MKDFQTRLLRGDMQRGSVCIMTRGRATRGHNEETKARRLDGECTLQLLNFKTLYKLDRSASCLNLAKPASTPRENFVVVRILRLHHRNPTCPQYQPWPIL